jgi:hypothetical protein
MIPKTSLRTRPSSVGVSRQGSHIHRSRSAAVILPLPGLLVYFSVAETASLASALRERSSGVTLTPTKGGCAEMQS